MKKIIALFMMAFLPLLLFGQGEHPIDHVSGTKYPGATIEATQFGYKFVHPDSTVNPANVIGIIRDSNLVYRPEMFASGQDMEGTIILGDGADSISGSFNGGRYNTILGMQSAFNLETGSRNTSVGNSALYTNETGNNNTALGYDALYTTTGADNVAVGGNALGVLESASLNVGIGSRVFLNLTSGFRNTGIGYQAGNNLTTGNENIAIGYNTQLASATSDNQLNIGNAITGNLNGKISIGNYTFEGNDGGGLSHGDILVYDSGTSSFKKYSHKTGSGSPVGSVTPDFENQIYRDTDVDTIYISVGLTNTDWVALN